MIVMQAASTMDDMSVVTPALFSLYSANFSCKILFNTSSDSAHVYTGASIAFRAIKLLKRSGFASISSCN